MVIKRYTYYDACTLDQKSTIQEILNNHKNHSTMAVVSHLAFGEAYENCRTKGQEEAKEFIELLHTL